MNGFLQVENEKGLKICIGRVKTLEKDSDLYNSKLTDRVKIDN